MNVPSVYTQLHHVLVSTDNVGTLTDPTSVIVTMDMKDNIVTKTITTVTQITAKMEASVSTRQV